VRVYAVVPSARGDWPGTRRLLESLAAQTTRPAGVVLSIDSEAAPAPDAGALERAGVAVEIVRGPAAGPGAARNRGLDRLAAMGAGGGDLVLFLNDDVELEPGCVAAHVAAHAARGGDLVVGAAPYVSGAERVVDRLVAGTSLVFFYDRMAGDGDPARDWGFRHAWTLNLSVAVRSAGRFDERLGLPMFDDLEWAFRATRGGRRVRHAAGAVAAHRHEPAHGARSLLRREAMLGHQALALRPINPACFAAVFGERPGFLDAPVRDGREAFRAFSARAEEDGAGADLERELAACGAWRAAARRVGWESAEAGAPFAEAAEAAYLALA